MNTQPRIPRRRAAVIPTCSRPQWYEFTLVRVLLGVAICLGASAAFAGLAILLGHAS